MFACWCLGQHDTPFSIHKWCNIKGPNTSSQLMNKGMFLQHTECMDNASGCCTGCTHPQTVIQRDNYTGARFCILWIFCLADNNHQRTFDSNDVWVVSSVFSSANFVPIETFFGPWSEAWNQPVRPLKGSDLTVMLNKRLTASLISSYLIHSWLSWCQFVLDRAAFRARCNNVFCL